MAEYIIDLEDPSVETFRGEFGGVSDFSLTEHLIPLRAFGVPTTGVPLHFSISVSGADGDMLGASSGVSGTSWQFLFFDMGEPPDYIPAEWSGVTLFDDGWRVEADWLPIFGYTEASGITSINETLDITTIDGVDDFVPGSNLYLYVVATTINIGVYPVFYDIIITTDNGITDGCPAWQDYRDTVEVCDVSVLDGEIYFIYNPNYFIVNPFDNEIGDPYPETTVKTIGSWQGGTPVELEVDFLDYMAFNTNLPNPELGEWSYEFVGTFTPTLEHSTIEEAFTFNLLDLGDGVFDWSCSVSLTSDLGEGGQYQAFNGVISIYYTLNSVVYGPLIINATVIVYNEP